MELLDHVDGPAHEVLHRLDGRGFSVFADAQDVPFHLVEQGVHLSLMLIDSGHDRRARREHASKDQLFANDLDVVGEVGRTGYGILQAAQISQAPNTFELVVVLELLLNRDEVDGLLLVVHVGQRLIDQLVTLVVEGFCTGFESLDAPAHGLVGGKEHASQNPLFSFGGVRGQSVQRGQVQLRANPPGPFEVRPGFIRAGSATLVWKVLHGVD